MTTGSEKMDQKIDSPNDVAGQAVYQTNQVIEERRGKLAALRKAGIAFPNDFERKHLAGDLHAEFGAKNHDELEALQVYVAVAGRMMLKRVMGKASFATVQDMSGKIQLFISNNDTGEEAHNAFKHYDLGDILGAVGVLFKTKTGELSVRVSQVRLLTKALRPLPEKFHGLSDQEQKYRQRYPHLTTNEDTRKVFIPLTTYCRDDCGYCTFKRDPGQPGARYLTPEEVLALAERGRAQGCKEALFSLGDKPELRFAEAAEAPARFGQRRTTGYLAEMCRRAPEQTGLLAHPHPGTLRPAEVGARRAGSPTSGILV